MASIALLLAAGCATPLVTQRSALPKRIDTFYRTDTCILGRSLTIFEKEGSAVMELRTANPGYEPNLPEGWTSCDFPWPNTNTSPDSLLSPLQSTILEQTIESGSWPGITGTARLTVLLRGQPEAVSLVIDRYFTEYARCPSNYVPVVVEYAADVQRLRKSGRVSQDVLRKIFPIDMGTEDLGEYWNSNNHCLHRTDESRADAASTGR
jgi:hypothetical protein